MVAIAVGAAFIACAIALPHGNDGVQFTLADQYGIGGTGVLVALAIMSITRPRMRANENGVDTRVVQLLLGHTKLESTVRYLGIEVDDALNIAEQIEL